ncbi:MAG: hypothetical protein HRT71_20515 [Flavobacteriales bacterium]|nr:hypothetical protein [Flavobacteriales bacterium]
MVDFLEIAGPDFQTRFISFQDSKNDDGSDSEESLKTLKMIDETIKFQ